MPHITEELYQIYFKRSEKAKSIHASEWPVSEKIADKEIEDAGDKAIDMIAEVRKLKSRQGKSLKTPTIITLDKKTQKELESFMEDLKSVTAAEIRTGEFKIELA